MLDFDRLNLLCKETGISKAHLCRLVERPRHYLRDSEAKNINIPDNYIQIFAEALHVTPTYLTGESNEKKPAPEGELVNGDPELTAYIQDLKDRPELRMLFSLTHNATREDVERAVRVIEALRHTDNPGQE